MKLKMLTSLILLGVFAQTLEAGTIKGKIIASRVRSPENVVISLEGVKGEFTPPKENPVMDQKSLIFIPHVLPVLAGTTVDFPNNDKVRHNVFSPSKAKKFNLGTYAAGVVRNVTFDTPGFYPLLCNVHAEMSAFILVFENPYFAVSNRDGEFEIKDVPAGTYTLRTWHQKLKESKQEVTVPEQGEIAVELKLER
ncbi:MAG: hypothetical protein FVQ81_12420 [Candidatus Glassbacteria bacterium]|nr:hypothetical protein [Candidatus Glassbacteria bacterium]